MFRLKPFVVPFLSTLLLSIPHTHADDAVAGKAKAVTCEACHGAAGISNNDQWPNLAGQKKGYLVAQLNAFRAGKRIDQMMQPMTKALTDKEIDDLATYYSGLTTAK